MPHQCTNCSRTFQDGSKQMLAGCPDCGGNKFQFLPKGAVDQDGETADPAAADSAAASPATPVSSTESETSSSVPTASTADGDVDTDIIEAPVEPVDEPAAVDLEDRAQASARRSIVSEDELPPVESRSDAEKRATATEEPDRPGLAELRQELNEQFESIKILQPGEYELNLMELYDRDEYIIALEEDGRYVIDVPDSWRDGS